MREYGLYNTETEELEDFLYLTQETADFLNQELRDKNSPCSWAHEDQESL
jgi:hypothetical protein